MALKSKINILAERKTKTADGITQDGTELWKDTMQSLLTNTYLARFTADRENKKDRLPTGFQATAVEVIDNLALKKKYAAYKEKLLAATGRMNPDTCSKSNGPAARTGVVPALKSRLHKSPCLNEVYLLHGTSLPNAKRIARSGYELKLAGTKTGTMLGPGVYLADSSTKADEYTAGDIVAKRCFVVFKAVLGRPLLMHKTPEFQELKTELGQSSLEEAREIIKKKSCNSLLRDGEESYNGSRPTFKEYVIFYSESIVPEFIVHYRRDRPEMKDTLGKLIFR